MPKASDWDKYCTKPAHIDPKEVDEMWKWLMNPKQGCTAPFLHTQDIRRDTVSGNPQWDAYVKLTHIPTGSAWSATKQNPVTRMKGLRWKG